MTAQQPDMLREEAPQKERREAYCEGRVRRRCCASAFASRQPPSATQLPLSTGDGMKSHGAMRRKRNAIAFSVRTAMRSIFRHASEGPEMRKYCTRTFPVLPLPQMSGEGCAVAHAGLKPPRQQRQKARGRAQHAAARRTAERRRPAHAQGSSRYRRTAGTACRRCLPPAMQRVAHYLFHSGDAQVLDGAKAEVSVAAR